MSPNFSHLHNANNSSNATNFYSSFKPTYNHTHNNLTHNHTSSIPSQNTSLNASMLESSHNNNNNNNNSTSLSFSSHSLNTSNKAKRHYNSEVDPARYRKVVEEGITKFACSICGNTYKWRKSLNKHWKEKHITETPPPLDAPVTVKLRNGNTTVNVNCGPVHSMTPVHQSAKKQLDLIGAPKAIGEAKSLLASSSPSSTSSSSVSSSSTSSNQNRVLIK